jgi:hypothetical protein
MSLNTVSKTNAFAEFNSIYYFEFAYPEVGDAKLDADLSFDTVLGLNGHFNVTFYNHANSTSHLTIDFLPSIFHNLTTIYNESGRVRSNNITGPYQMVDHYQYQVPPNTTWITRVTQNKQEFETDVANQPQFNIVFGAYNENFEIIEPINGTARMRVIVSDVVYGTFRTETSTLNFTIIGLAVIPIILIRKLKN